MPDSVSQHFSQYSETDPLKITFIGRAEGYGKNEAYIEIVNEAQRAGLPEESKLIEEFTHFKSTLEKLGVEVRIPEYVGKFVYDQLTPRDIAVVIGHKLVLCNMVRASRKYEVAGIFSRIKEFSGREPDILIPPPGALLEGGDIIIDKGRIFVGISQRSNQAGFEWLKALFRNEFDIIPLYTKSLAENENVLHLDCTFNPVGENFALIYVDGFSEIPDTLREYEWLKVDKKEQSALATNVLSISKNLLIARDHPDCARINERLREKGIEVVEIPFDGAPSTGGSFRCCSLPLLRTSDF